MPIITWFKSSHYRDILKNKTKIPIAEDDDCQLNRFMMKISTFQLVNRCQNIAEDIHKSMDELKEITDNKNEHDTHHKEENIAISEEAKEAILKDVLGANWKERIKLPNE